MNKLSNVKIQSNGTETHVFVDGQEIKGLQRVSFSHDVTHMPKVTLDIFPHSVTLDGWCVCELGKELVQSEKSSPVEEHING